MLPASQHVLTTTEPACWPTQGGLYRAIYRAIGQGQRLRVLAPGGGAPGEYPGRDRGRSVAALTSRQRFTFQGSQLDLWETEDTQLGRWATQQRTQATGNGHGQVRRRFWNGNVGANQRFIDGEGKSHKAWHKDTFWSNQAAVYSRSGSWLLVEYI